MGTSHLLYKDKKYADQYIALYEKSLPNHSTKEALMGKKPKRKRVKQPNKKLHEDAWSLARSLMDFRKKHFDRDLCNKHVYCEVCKRGYCLGFDGTDQYCETCYYKPYYVGEEYMPNCQKPVVGTRTCQQCGGTIC